MREQTDFLERLKADFGIALNPQQARAVETVDGSVLLLAVPGSGKTTVLISRLANMIFHRGISPGHILTVTFGRRSAQDLRDRYRALFAKQAEALGVEEPRFSTIHQFCYAVVRRISSQYKRPLPRMVEDVSDVVRSLYCGLDNVRFAEREKLDELVNAIGYAKNRLMDDAQVARMVIEDCNFPRLFSAYKSHMRENGLMDYDDMLVFTYEMFSKNPGFLAQYQEAYQYFCVDEAQDTSLVQHKILGLLAEKSGNLFMVGDEDQSIYGFRGAYPDALLDFGKDHPGAVILKMEENYRCAGTVVDAANRLIGQNSERIEKRMVTSREPGLVEVHEVTRPSAQYAVLVEQLQKCQYGSEAVLYRNNESAIPLVDVLTDAGIPFSLKDTREAFFQTPHILDICAFLRLALDPGDVESFTRIYSKTSAYFSRGVLEFVTQHHRPGDNVWSVLAACPLADGDRVAVLRRQMTRVAAANPLDALILLEDVTRKGYFEGEAAARRAALLRSIASRRRTLPDLLDRLEELRRIVGETPAFGRGALTLSTMHSSKGLEYDRVWLVDLIEGQFPPKASVELLEEGDRSVYEEEVRLCYVAATRARNALHLITFKPTCWEFKPSRFVALLTKDAPMSSSKNQKKASLGGKPQTTPKQPKEIDGYLPVTTAEMLSPGIVVLHDAFGEGRVIRVEKGFLIWFDGVVTKRLALDICIENRNLYVKK